VTPEEAVGLFADDGRLRVIAALVLEPGTTDTVAARSGVPARKTIAALTRLESAGVALRDGAGTWSFDGAALRDAARSARPGPAAPATTPAEAVLRSFVVDGRLAQIPAARSKRLVVLDRLAAEFEPGATYDEKQVNDTLRAWHDDVAALRRYLVDEAFLSRDHGIYWRTGGTVDLAGRAH
jgi:hypothetical protein